MTTTIHRDVVSAPLKRLDLLLRLGVEETPELCVLRLSLSYEHRATKRTIPFIGKGRLIASVEHVIARHGLKECPASYAISSNLRGGTPNHGL